MISDFWNRLTRGPKTWRLIGLVAVLLVVVWAGRESVLKRVYPFPYRDEVLTYSREHGLDPHFVAAIIRNESGFNPNARSRAGALGLMQVMPDTGRWVAQALGFADYTPELLKDPATNIMIGTWYLADLKREFSGNLVLVVAAYNAGRGRVREWVERDGWQPDPVACEMVPWPGQEVTEDYPLSKIALSETRSYVRNVIDALKRYRALYGEMVVDQPGEAPP